MATEGMRGRVSKSIEIWQIGGIGIGKAGMSKRLDAMRRNPAGDWRISDIVDVCRDYGLVCLSPRAGGSHYKIAHSSQREILTIPFKRPIKPVYIRKLVDYIDAVRSQT
jgi:hypothetical protein